MKNNNKFKTLILLMILLLIPINAKAAETNVSLNCKGTEEKIYPGSNVACTINVSAGYINVEEFEAKIEIPLADISIVNFEPKKGMGDDLGVPRGDTDNRPTISVAAISSTGSFVVGVLNLKIDDNATAGQQLKVQLDKITINDNKDDQGSAYAIIRIEAKKTKTDEGKKDEVVTPTPVVPTPTPAKEETKQPTKTTTTVSNPPTGNISLAIVGIILIASLSIAFYIYNKKKKTN